MADLPDRTFDLAIRDILEGAAGRAEAPAGAPSAARGPGDPHLATLEDLTRLLLEEASLEQLLDQTLELTVRAVRASVSVSVTVVEDDGTYLTLARTDEDAAAADALQHELAAGPCIEALEQAEERYVTDLCSDGRWPAVAERATELGLRCMLAVPLLVGGRCLGALTVSSPDADGIDAADRELVRRIATPTATTLANGRAYQRVSRLAEQLEEALDSRATIERAKGVLMAREGADADEAFDRLRRASQQHNRKLRDVAQAVVASHEGAHDPGGAG
jgi:GAF domain-containing protein